MDDLYNDLGISRDASERDISAAFRVKAKIAHPDAGGSEEQFSRISRAKLILIDPQKRARYDSTGQADDRADNDRAEILAQIAQLLDRAMAEATNLRKDVEAVDLVSLMHDITRREIAQGEMIIAETLNRARKFRSIAKRFRTKTGKNNPLRSIMEGRAKDLDIQAESQGRLLTRFRAVLAEIEHQSFDPMSSEQAITQPGYTIFHF